MPPHVIAETSREKLQDSDVEARATTPMLKERRRNTNSICTNRKPRQEHNTIRHEIHVVKWMSNAEKAA